MKEQLTRIYLLLTKNKLTVFLSLVIIFTIKQVLAYIILFNQGTAISMWTLVSHICLQLLILLALFFIVKSNAERNKLEKHKYEALRQTNITNKEHIEKLKQEILSYSKAESSVEESSFEEIVENVKERLYGSLKQGETLDVVSMFRRLCLSFDVGVGILYESKKGNVSQIADFDLPIEDKTSYLLGEGLIGEVARSGESITLCNLPGGYFESFSGLGSATPKNLQVFKVVDYVFEIGTHKALSESEINAFKEIIVDSFSRK